MGRKSIVLDRDAIRARARRDIVGAVTSASLWRHGLSLPVEVMAATEVMLGMIDRIIDGDAHAAPEPDETQDAGPVAGDAPAFD